MTTCDKGQARPCHVFVSYFLFFGQLLLLPGLLIFKQASQPAQRTANESVRLTANSNSNTNSSRIHTCLKNFFLWDCNNLLHLVHGWIAWQTRCARKELLVAVDFLSQVAATTASPGRRSCLLLLLLFPYGSAHLSCLSTNALLAALAKDMTTKLYKLHNTNISGILATVHT